jgi:hypothetical protein
MRRWRARASDCEQHVGTRQRETTPPPPPPSHHIQRSSSFLSMMCSPAVTKKKERKKKHTHTHTPHSSLNCFTWVCGLEGVRSWLHGEKDNRESSQVGNNTGLPADKEEHSIARVSFARTPCCVPHRACTKFLQPLSTSAHNRQRQFFTPKWNDMSLRRIRCEEPCVTPSK